MDSFDIFKKLSSGANFSQSKKKKIKIEVKQEDKNEESSSYLATLQKKGNNELSSSDIESVARFRNSNNISVKGKNVPFPISSFNELEVNSSIRSRILQNVADCGYLKPTPVQMQAIPIIAAGRQILACAPTGSGKTAAFLIPVLMDLEKPSHGGFRALILCPTRELAKQTYRECSRLAESTGLKPHIISKVTATSNKFGPNFSKKFDILISTPNRLIYLMRREDSIITFNALQWLIVDECDKLFEVGKGGFHEQLAEIYQACNSKNVKRLMFSATYMVHLARWCRKNIKGMLYVTIGQRNAAAEEVQQELLYVGNENGKLIAFRDIIHQGLSPPVLVFVQSKERAKELFNELIFDGINVDVIHADRTQLQRDNVVCAFREGKIWVLICTELMGRGIDFKGVKLVINYDFPPSAVSYIHRIGRTGRAGRPGKAITFFTEEDKPCLRSIARIISDSGCPVPEYMLSMKKIRKDKRKQMEQQAPKRKTISTSIKYEKYRSNKIKRWKEASKKKSKEKLEVSS